MDYKYKAIIVSIYDGDTIRVDIDLGFGIWKKNESIRLYGINTPEIRGEEREQGLISKAKLIEKIPVGSEVVIETFKDKKEKYGRYLAIIYSNGSNINEEMLKEGYALEYML